MLKKSFVYSLVFIILSMGLGASGSAGARPAVGISPAPLLLPGDGNWEALSGPSATGISFGFAILAVDSKGNVYAGGTFTKAGGVTVNNVAKWNGSGWEALSGQSATGMNNPVYALVVDSQDNLYVGGSFTTAGGVPTLHVAKWDGSNWSPLNGPIGPGLSGPVFALAVDNQDNVYAGGISSANFRDAVGR